MKNIKVNKTERNNSTKKKLNEDLTKLIKSRKSIAAKPEV